MVILVSLPSTKVYKSFIFLKLRIVLLSTKKERKIHRKHYGLFPHVLTLSLSTQ